MTFIYKVFKLNTSLETDPDEFIQHNDRDYSRKRLTFENCRTDP